jgi:hypothetical protein
VVTKLIISKEVAAGSEEYTTFTPAEDSSPVVTLFQGDGPSTRYAVVKLIWKYGQAGESVLWTIKGDSRLDISIPVPENEVDGINQLAIALENSDTMPIFLSGLAIIEDNL